MPATDSEGESINSASEASNDDPDYDEMDELRAALARDSDPEGNSDNEHGLDDDEAEAEDDAGNDGDDGAAGSDGSKPTKQDKYRVPVSSLPVGQSIKCVGRRAEKTMVIAAEQIPNDPTTWIIGHQGLAHENRKPADPGPGFDYVLVHPTGKSQRLFRGLLQFASPKEDEYMVVVLSAAADKSAAKRACTEHGVDLTPTTWKQLVTATQRRTDSALTTKARQAADVLSKPYASWASVEALEQHAMKKAGKQDTPAQPMPAKKPAAKPAPQLFKRKVSAQPPPAAPPKRAKKTPPAEPPKAAALSSAPRLPARPTFTMPPVTVSIECPADRCAAVVQAMRTALQ
ncbi:MAG: hypothetical protein ACPGR8_13490 [Limisphaerales bacterium]